MFDYGKCVAKEDKSSKPELEVAVRSSDYYITGFLGAVVAKNQTAVG